MNYGSEQLGWGKKAAWGCDRETAAATGVREEQEMESYVAGNELYITVCRQ